MKMVSNRYSANRVIISFLKSSDKDSDSERL